MKVVSLAMVAVLGATVSPASATTRSPKVVQRTRISGPVTLAAPCSAANANGPHVAVDPVSPHHVAVVQTLGEDIAGVVATSEDGGTSWTRAPLTGFTPCTGSTQPNGHIGDPMIAIGSGGRVDATAGWVRWTPDFGTDHDTVRLYLGRSDDGGRSFASAVEPDPGGADQRGSVSFDPGSNDGVLVAFQRVHYLNPPAPLDSASTYVYGLGSSLGVVRSSDGGATWAARVFATTAYDGEELATIALLRSGPAIVLVGVSVDDSEASAFLAHQTDSIAEHLFVVRSLDGGTHWTDRISVPGATYHFPRIATAATPGWAIPDATAGPDGTILVTYPDAAAHAVIVYRSSDGGESWSTTTTVTSTGAPLEPAVASNAAGAIGVFFYDVTADGDRQWVTPKLATSSDNGVSWQTVALASPFDAAAITASACPDGLFSCDGTPMGPYQDLVGVPGGYAATVTLGDPHASSGGAEDTWWIRAAAEQE